MSQHIITTQSEVKYVFGWDQMLQSYFLQVHYPELKENEINPVVWLGADLKTTMYDVEELVETARKFGLDISPSMQRVLYADKDEGR